MDEFAVNNTAEETVLPDDAGQAVSTEQLPSGNEQQASPEQTDGQSGDGGQPQGWDQRKIGGAFAQMRRDLTDKYENHPAYVLGMRMLNDVMTSGAAKTIEEAGRVAQESYIKAIAEREGVSPYMVRQMFAQQQQRNQQRETQDTGAPDVNAIAGRVRQELPGLNLPGFAFESAIKDEAFAQMLVDGYPVKAAAELYQVRQQLTQAQQTAAQAPQALAEQLAARRAVPQSTKPQQPVTPAVNFGNMTDAEFLAWERKNT